jgi:LPS O-antigen subunit length determinant protein (WzzB/FepE family)
VLIVKKPDVIQKNELYFCNQGSNVIQNQLSKSKHRLKSFVLQAYPNRQKNWELPLKKKKQKVEMFLFKIQSRLRILFEKRIFSLFLALTV